MQWASINAEAQGIAQYVVQRIEQGDVSAGQVLILAPRRQLGYAVRDSLLEAGVVAHSFFNEQALDGNPKGAGCVPGAGDVRAPDASRGAGGPCCPPMLVRVRQRWSGRGRLAEDSR